MNSQDARTFIDVIEDLGRLIDEVAQFVLEDDWHKVAELAELKDKWERRAVELADRDAAEMLSKYRSKCLDLEQIIGAKIAITENEIRKTALARKILCGFARNKGESDYVTEPLPGIMVDRSC
ncbi:MAG: hypothetical protein HRF49_06175 [bacterium]